ncbi:MAG: hypothetical protein NC102_05560 [Clostridium sp.]|nr:hypothetical protein [Clostridium sp.]
MKLIADCGSTKIDWCLITKDGSNGTVMIEKRFETPGLNAVMLTTEEIRQRLDAELAPVISPYAEKVDNVYFYGAGCISPSVCGNVADALKAIMPNAAVEVDTDLLAAARALCGREAGIACILGTGSNSCYYDGESIKSNVSPLGYILGDEGSGAVLGKLLVGNVLKNQLPEDLCEKFLAQYGLDRMKIIENVYRKPGANKFLASLSPFIKENIDRPEIKDMAVEAFRQFFIRNISNYDGMQGEGAAVNFVGSIAFHYRKQLAQAAASCGYELGAVIKSPMEGLLRYHTQMW